MRRHCPTKAVHPAHRPPSPRIVLAAAALGLTVLAGCASAPPEEANPEMGPDLINPQEAGRMFANICAATLPDFAAAPAAIARYPMVRNTSTGLYVHRNAQFQAGLQDGQCYVLFKAIDAEQQVVLAVDQGLVDEGYTDLAFSYDVIENPDPGMSGYAFIMDRQ